MALFPVSADKVQLSVTAPLSTDAFVCGILRDASNMVARAALSGGVQWNNGLLMTSLGQVVYVDATAGLPAGTQYINGLPISPAGALCVSSGAAVSYSNGLPFAANGALSGVTSLAAGVAALMASFSGPKIWLDPSDLTTLQQDAAGTTPVTAAGDPIGRIMDKSGAANHATQATTTSRPLWQTTYAALDGVDDSWATGSIDFTSTAQITVVAGVKANTTTGIQMLLEQGAAYTAAPGRFEVTANELAAGGFTFARTSSIGPVVNQYRGETVQAVPRTVVISASSDFTISTAVAGISIRANGASASTTTGGTAGTSADYANDVLNIGRRNNTNLPFNGSLYGLIIIGRLLTAPELTLCEQYMAQQAGISF